MRRYFIESSEVKSRLLKRERNSSSFYGTHAGYLGNSGSFTLENPPKDFACNCQSLQPSLLWNAAWAGQDKTSHANQWHNDKSEAECFLQKQESDLIQQGYNVRQLILDCSYR